MITPDIILTGLDARSKKQVFQIIAQEVQKLTACDSESTLTALLEREKIGSTAIGDGIAIPHVRLQGLDRMVGILMRLSQPVDFDANDDKPVDIIFTLLAPESAKNNSHLKMLGRISRFLRDAQNCTELRACMSCETIARVIDDWESEAAA